jgi:hypothetical protein
MTKFTEKICFSEITAFKIIKSLAIYNPEWIIVQKTAQKYMV